MDGLRFDPSNVELFRNASGDVVTGASLGIPDQTIEFDLSTIPICDTCIFTFPVELFTFARNAEAESLARAFFRDPVHFGDLTDPGAGGARVAYEGVTVRPVPEPATAACLAGGLAIVGAARRRRMP